MVHTCEEFGGVRAQARCGEKFRPARQHGCEHPPWSGTRASWARSWAVVCCGVPRSSKLSYGSAPERHRTRRRQPPYAAFALARLRDRASHLLLCTGAKEGKLGKHVHEHGQHDRARASEEHPMLWATPRR
eukprot:3848676-Prymnesium_polylepis.2